MSTTSVLFEFTPGPNGAWTAQYDVADSLIQASKQGLTPAYRQAYMHAMAGYMKGNEEQGVAMSQAVCAVCNVQPKRQVLMTPMSYLHLETPKVSVLVTPVCGSKPCDDMGKILVNQLVLDAMGEMSGAARGTAGALPGSIKDGFGFRPPAKGGPCPCGSKRKYKKCCGRESSMDDVD